MNPKRTTPTRPPPKYTVLNDRNYAYICACQSTGRDPVLDSLRARTEALGEIAKMQIGRDQGAFMTMLVAAVGAREAIEVGSFTGYSAICIARGLAKDGSLLCLDASKEWTDIAREYWSRAKLDKMIELRLAPALDSLKKLERGRKFDFAFIDAEKTEYDDYYETILPRMRRNGLILFDNMLWGGRLGGKGSIKNKRGRAIDQLNRKLARDPRVESTLLALADGLNICRVLR